MNLIEFGFQEDSPGFLDISSTPPLPLHELFTTTTSSYSPAWDLSSREVEENFEESRINNFAMKHESFKKIKIGTQDQNSGEVDVSLAKSYCESLNDLSSETHIAFSKKRISNPLTGGTCSAMSFEFANDYLKTRSTTSFKIENDRLTKNPQPSPNEIFDTIGDKYISSSKYFRTIQSTFNTLHKDEKEISDDFMLDKIASMLRFYDRQVIDASELFYLEFGTREEIETAQEKIRSFLDKSLEGVYVVRSILFDENDKGEAYGHTTILIKENDEMYFFDPNEGIFELSEDPDAVVDILKHMMQKWMIPFGRIYKIQ